jgi:hypothetical protein
MMRVKPYITAYKNNQPVIVDEKLFEQYRTYIMDTLNAQVKYVYNRAKEMFTQSDDKTVNSGDLQVTTNLKGGMEFTPNGEVIFSDSKFKAAIDQLVNDLSALILTYNRPDEFLTVMQTEEFWALIIFVAADQNLTDLLADAMTAFFNATWGKTKKNPKDYQTRKSFIDMMQALRNGYNYDLSDLVVYDSDGKQYKLQGTVKACGK